MLSLASNNPFSGPLRVFSILQQARCGEWGWVSIPAGGPKHYCARMAAPYTKGEWTLNFLIGGCIVDAGFLMGEETQGHGTVEGAEEVAPHFNHPFMFLGPKGPVGSFLL